MKPRIIALTACGLLLALTACAAPEVQHQDTTPEPVTYGTATPGDVQPHESEWYFEYVTTPQGEVPCLTHTYTEYRGGGLGLSCDWGAVREENQQ